MERNLYRQVMEIIGPHREGSVRILVVFPAATFADVPYWTPGPGFRICMPNRTWLKDNPDGTVEVVASYVTPKIGIAAWDGGEWTEPELWSARVPAGHWGLTSVLWDKPHRITHFLEKDEEEEEGLLLPSTITDRTPHAGHPIEAILEYWDDFSLRRDFTPRRLEAFPGYSDRYGLVADCSPDWGSDLHTYTISELVYKVTKIAREFDAEIHILPQSL